MPARFSLESRANSKAEYPIRVYWCYLRNRFQTTLRITVKQCNWDAVSKRVLANTVNSKGVDAANINRVLERIELLTVAIENKARIEKLSFKKNMMRIAISNVMSFEKRNVDVIVEGLFNSIRDSDNNSEYYRFKGNDFLFHFKTFNLEKESKDVVLYQITGNSRIISVSEECFIRSFIKTDKSELVGIESDDYW